MISFFKKGRSKTPRAGKRFEHPELGTFVETRPDVLPDYYDTTVSLGAAEIKLTVFQDDQELDAALALAAMIAADLPGWHTRARAHVADQMLDTHNDGWCGEVPTDRAIFISKLTLSSINVTGRDMVEFFFDDGGLFWGHALIANYADLSQDKISDAKIKADVSMFG